MRQKTKAYQRVCSFDQCVKMIRPYAQYCDEHRQEARRKTWRISRNKSYRKYRKKIAKDWRARRKEQLAKGLCGRPGCTDMAIANRTVCKKHQKIASVQNKKYRDKQKLKMEVTK